MYILYSTYVLRDDGACIPFDPANSSYQAYLEWVAEGNTASVPAGPDFADYVGQFMGLFSAWIVDVVQGNTYDSPESCASYVTSGVKQFKDDATSFIAWRDALWIWAAQWQAGYNGALPTTIPAWDEVKAMAPQPEAFGWVVHPQGQIIS